MLYFIYNKGHPNHTLNLLYFVNRDTDRVLFCGLFNKFHNKETSRTHIYICVNIWVLFGPLQSEVQKGVSYFSIILSG